MNLKKDLISIIVQLGINETELVLDLNLSKVTFNSIEWRKPQQIILHKFKGDNDYEYNFDELPKSIKKEIHNKLMLISTTC